MIITLAGFIFVFSAWIHVICCDQYILNSIFNFDRTCCVVIASLFDLLRVIPNTHLQDWASINEAILGL